MYLDSNANGVHDFGDLLNACRVPTTVDVYLITNQNRDGSAATCAGELPDTPLSISSYTLILAASRGTVAYSEFIDRMSWTPLGVELFQDNIHYQNGYTGSTMAAGSYKLCTMTITALAGSPTVEIIDSFDFNGAEFTSFGSDCYGVSWEGILRLDGAFTRGYQGEADWFDADGLAAAPIDGGMPVEFGTTSLDVAGLSASVAIGDLDGNGKLDLTAANPRNNAVSVLVGAGGGRFATYVTHGVGVGPECVAIGDLNRDGRLDVVTANAEVPYTVSVLIGYGDGSFAPKVDYATGNGSRYVAVGDFDGDGQEDLVTANHSHNTLSVLLGGGDGTFGTRADYNVAGGPWSVAIGDLSGDGIPDLATANNDGTVSVLLGSGDGSFSEKADYPTGPNPHSVAIGHMETDGEPYLVTANSDNTVSVLLGNGDGSFRAAIDYEAGNGSYSVALGDVSGDGHSDVAVTNIFANAVSIFPGNGFGGLGTRTDVELVGAWDPCFIAIGDVDGDLRPDLVTANRSGSVSVLLNHPGGVQPLQVGIDLDPDVINLSSHAPWLTAYIEPSGFDPTTIDVSALRLACSVLPVPKFAVLGDHNGNGMPDLMVKFGRGVLDPLLTLGANELELTGTLVTGEAFTGIGEVRVIDPPGAPLSASVAPNPLNPAGVLTFHTTKPGPLRVAIFDAHGRLVRVLMDTPTLSAGTHTVLVDGRGPRGLALASGIHFYRVEAAEGSVVGRIAILK